MSDTIIFDFAPISFFVITLLPANRIAGFSKDETRMVNQVASVDVGSALAVSGCVVRLIDMILCLIFLLNEPGLHADVLNMRESQRATPPQGGFSE